MGLFDFFRSPAPAAPVSEAASPALRAAISAEREKRSAAAVEVLTEDTDRRLLAMLGLSGGVMAGVPVTQQTVMSIAAVFACVNNISMDVAGLPCQLFETGDQGRVRISDHPALPLLNRQASGLQNSFHFRQTMTALTLLRGNAYARIERAGRLKPVRLHFKHPDETTVTNYNGRLWYRFAGDPTLYADYDVLHFKGLSLDGVMGVSVLHYFRETFGKQLAASQSHSLFYKNGARPSGALETDKTLTAGAQERLAESFARKYSGVDNAGKPLILEEGLKYKTMSLSPADAEFISTHKLTRSDIASIFRMPPHKIGDLERSTNNNIEQQSLDYVGDTLMPILLAQEQEYNIKLLRTDEAGTHAFKHNVSAQMRADATARSTFYQKMIQAGVLSIDEVRALEEMNNVPGGDRRFVQVNLMPLDKVDEVLASRAAKPATTPPPTDD